MRKYIGRAFGLVRSGTARDTYILFSGNLFAAFLGFVFTVIVARALSVEDFGILSAATNLIVIVSSLTDLGISSGLISFAAAEFSRKNIAKAYEYAKAAFLIKVLATLPLVLFLILFASFVARNWLATSDRTVSYWVAAISFLAVIWGFLPSILHAKKKFLQSVLIDVSLSLPKAVIPYFLLIAGVLTINSTLAAFTISVAVAGFVGFAFTGVGFLRAKPKKEIYLKLVKFSSWLGVNRIISSISGRLDIQMLAAIAGAAATGIYSIPAKLSSFIVVLSSSLSSVLAPRFAAFENREKERSYLIKATLAVLATSVGIVFWIIIAKPFIVLLFGVKYIESVPVFQALSAAMIPYLLAVPPVTAIIYALKKTVFIGLFSFFQLAAIFALNYIFIPIYGPIGPTIAFGAVHTVLMIYSWTIVVKYYWIDK